jgi:anti-sigma B factor antagonist
VIDLDQVTFIDATGLDTLVAAANRTETHGGSLHVVCARSKILNLFRLTGLDRRLPPPDPGRGAGSARTTTLLTSRCPTRGR